MKVRTFRKKRNLTQRELSVLSGVGRASIARYENGTRIPSMATAKRLAGVLGCTIDELVSDAAPWNSGGPTLVRDVRDMMEEER